MLKFAAKAEKVGTKLVKVIEKMQEQIIFLNIEILLIICYHINYILHYIFNLSK